MRLFKQLYFYKDFLWNILKIQIAFPDKNLYNIDISTIDSMMRCLGMFFESLRHFKVRGKQDRERKEEQLSVIREF